MQYNNTAKIVLLFCYCAKKCVWAMNYVNFLALCLFNNKYAFLTKCAFVSLHSFFNIIFSLHSFFKHFFYIYSVWNARWRDVEKVGKLLGLC